MGAAGTSCHLHQQPLTGRGPWSKFAARTPGAGSPGTNDKVDAHRAESPRGEPQQVPNPRMTGAPYEPDLHLPNEPTVELPWPKGSNNET